MGGTFDNRVRSVMVSRSTPGIEFFGWNRGMVVGLVRLVHTIGS